MSEMLPYILPAPRQSRGTASIVWGILLLLLGVITLPILIGWLITPLSIWLIINGSNKRRVWLATDIATTKK